MSETKEFFYVMAKDLTKLDPSLPTEMNIVVILPCLCAQKETDVELGSLLRSEAMSVYNQLLLYLSVSYNKVFSGLSMLASKDDSYTGCKDLKTRDDMVRIDPQIVAGLSL